MSPPPGSSSNPDADQIRFPWSRTERAVPRLVLRPLQNFLETEASSGTLLLAAAVVALVWANSPLAGSYERLWETRLTISVAGFELSEDLRHWVNDALMTLFFFVVGLEIKRELISGELANRRAAMLPALGALGGMVVPALIYLALNPTGPSARGWGIPMATDIAFALGVLAIVGRRLPAALKSFLLALAIVDDIGAIAVIAIFYAADINGVSLGVAVGLVAVMELLRRLEVRWMFVYVILGMGVWLATFESGVHATIAGVVLGLLAPAEPFQRPRAVSDEAVRVAELTTDEPATPDQDAHHWLHLARLSQEAVSQLARLETLLHPWTSFLIVPLFALANAGVRLEAQTITAAVEGRVAAGIVLGLVVGKPLGITLAAWIGTRLGIARLPGGVRWPDVIGVSAVAGIGFTVSLFIAALAFQRPELASAARLGILVASALATLVGGVVIWVASRGRERD